VTARLYGGDSTANPRLAELAGPAIKGFRAMDVTSGKQRRKTPRSVTLKAGFPVMLTDSTRVVSKLNIA